MREHHLPDPSTMTEADRFNELAALLSLGVLRCRELARRCGTPPAAQTGEIAPPSDLNSPRIEAVIDPAVDAAQNGERA